MFGKKPDAGHPIEMSTLDHANGRPYTVLQVIEAQYAFLKYAPDKALEKLEEEARKLGADAVIGVRLAYAPCPGGYLSAAFGTAIRWT